MADLTALEKRHLRDALGEEGMDILDRQDQERGAQITGAVNDAAAAQLAANSAAGDATQALADAATADGKAVAAQGDATQALADAATADGKAVAAQGDATQALADAATADGKAVAAQGDATQALTDAATADGKAVAAQGDATQALADASTADGKAVAAQGDASQALSDAATALTAAGKMGSGTPVNAVASTGAVALNDAPHEGDTVQIGTITYRFKGTLAQANDVLIEVSAADNAANLDAAINLGAGGGTKYHINTLINPDISSTVIDDDLTVTAKVKGVAGDLLDLIEVSEHITLSGAKLAGGVNGTVGAAGAHLFDGSNIYICTATNTIADANWCKAAIASF